MFQLFNKRKSQTPRAASNRGFTMVELVITVAVMGILLAVSTPSIYAFMRQRDNQKEEIALGEIRKAMQAYLADTGELPADTIAAGFTPWYNKLAGYTSMSANEIQNDTWGRERRYLLYTNTERKLFGNVVNVYYATIHSAGINGKAEKTYIDSTNATVTISGMGVTGTVYDSASSTTWWKMFSTTAGIINAFSTLRPGGDDVLLRFTNYAEVLDSYNATVQRLDHVTQALETYARSGYAERVSECSGASPSATRCGSGIPEKTIYYPHSLSKEQTGTGAENANVLYNNPAIIVNNSQSDAARRSSMIDLMNLLGLPAEYCCSALDTFVANATTGERLTKPFYYFSNPRSRGTTGCATRPDFNSAKLPARITTKYNSESSPDRTCG